MAAEVKPINGFIGAEVHGVHLGRLDDATFAEVRAAGWSAS